MCDVQQEVRSGTHHATAAALTPSLQSGRSRANHQIALAGDLCESPEASPVSELCGCRLHPARLAFFRPAALMLRWLSFSAIGNRLPLPSASLPASCTGDAFPAAGPARPLPTTTPLNLNPAGAARAAELGSTSSGRPAALAGSREGRAPCRPREEVCCRRWRRRSTASASRRPGR